MRLDELFKNLGFLAGTIGSQMRHGAFHGVPLAELDLTGPVPHKVSLCGPAQVVLGEGNNFGIEVEDGPSGNSVLFALDEGRLGIDGGDADTVIRITLPAPQKLAVAGSGRLEVGAVRGGILKVSIAGSGRLAIDGQADELDLSIAGSGACDGEGLMVGKASVHIAGSGDAIFACNGEVAAHLMGSGSVIVRGSARCSVHSMGSGTVTCEPQREAAN